LALRSDPKTRQGMTERGLARKDRPKIRVKIATVGAIAQTEIPQTMT
jgi:hypothetical protein